ncbi:MAG TPA: carboxypeptidase-like regulatory domain-containing protein, partial [Polyangia bacterium]
KGLAHDQLYGSADAAVERPAGLGNDADASPEDATLDLDQPDSISPDASEDLSSRDAPAADTSVDGEIGERDAVDDTVPDALSPADGAPDGGDAPPAPCTPASCPSDQFCDDLSGACLPRQGTGMISGAVYDSCLHVPVNAKVGIAGQHACAASGKGSYFFSQIPLGRLTVTAAAPGYQLFTKEVTIVPGGNSLNIALDRSAPITCADPAPAAVACACSEPGCVTP